MSAFRCRRSLFLACLAWIALTGATQRAWGDPAARARYHDERARNFYQRNNFDAAVQEFLLSEQTAANPRTAFNIALCFERLNRPAEAYSYFSEYTSSSDNDDNRRSYAHQALASLSTRIARIHV